MTDRHEQRPPARLVRDRRGAAADTSGAPIPDSDPLLWPIEQVALALSISRRTLEREIVAGRFPRADVRIGTMNRWKPGTVRDWIDRRA